MGAAEDCLDIPKADTVGTLHFPPDACPVRDLLCGAATVGGSDGCGIIMDIVGEPVSQALLDAQSLLS